MNQSPQIKARINAIAKDLAEGKERGELLIKFGKKWSMSKSSFDRLLKLAKPIAKRLSDLKDKVVNDTITEETKEAVKSGLKSKFERVMILQNQCEKIEQELEANVSTDYVLVSDKLQKVVKEISVTDRAYLRKTLKDLQAEISKIEGDYAPTKNAFTDATGNDIKVTLNLS